jgi:hypothetical protein
VIGERLGVLVATSERFDPPRDALMLVCPLPSRDLAVRDVANKEMQERVLRLFCN